MLETKIKKLLPFWLLFIALFVLLQISVAVVFDPASPSLAANGKVLGTSVVSARGQEIQSSAQKIKKESNPDLSRISAKSFIAFDLDTGQTLLEKNPDEKLGIASLTKLMTALVAYKELNLNQTINIEKKGLVNVSPVLHLKEGDRVRILDLFNAMLIGSANDAAQVLAESTEDKTGAKITDLMNSEAGSLEMAGSLFSNPVGFDSVNNYSTASDLKKLILQTQKFSAFTDIGRRNKYDFISDSGTHYKITATNRLLNQAPNIYAIKTGFTERSGGSMATKIILGTTKIGLVVLGSENRENDTLELKKALETNFSWD